MDELFVLLFGTVCVLLTTVAISGALILFVLKTFDQILHQVVEQNSDVVLRFICQSVLERIDERRKEKEKARAENFQRWFDEMHQQTESTENKDE